VLNLAVGSFRAARVIPGGPRRQGQRQHGAVSQGTRGVKLRTRRSALNIPPSHPAERRSPGWRDGQDPSRDVGVS
jgi:hypothetical protein